MAAPRQPVVAGLFYPEDPVELSTRVEQFLSRAHPQLPGRGSILGLVVPHAGYPYSGGVAAYSYQAIREIRPKRIILIGPSHREAFTGCSVYNGSAFSTPLGEIPVDITYCQQFTDTELLFLSTTGHLAEHALEVQLPFLQVIYDHDYSIVPITMGSQNPETVETLARELYHHWETNQIILASSDLSHYYTYHTAVQMDTLLQQTMNTLDTGKMWKQFETGVIEACGFGPVLTLLELAKYFKNPVVHQLSYANSGDVTGDRSGVVGYLAAAVTAA